MDTAGYASLSVITDLSPGKNTLDGNQVLLTRHRLSDILRHAGLDLPPQTSHGQAWLAFMNACKSNAVCEVLNPKVSKDIVTGFIMPAEGRGVFEDRVPVGTYYVSCNSSLSDPVILHWEIEVNLTAGENSVVLAISNAEEVHDEVTDEVRKLRSELSGTDWTAIWPKHP
jgi:hypothetical protein